MKTTLEEINIRINEAEEQIHELEDRLMEITAREQKRKKEWKEIRTIYKTSGIANLPTFTL